MRGGKSDCGSRKQRPDYLIIIRTGTLHQRVRRKSIVQNLPGGDDGTLRKTKRKTAGLPIRLDSGPAVGQRTTGRASLKITYSTTRVRTRSSRDNFLSSRRDNPGTICRISYNQKPILRSRTFFLSTSLPIPSSQSINRRKSCSNLTNTCATVSRFAGPILRES